MDEKIYLVTSKTLQSSLLKENLELKLNRKIEPITFTFLIDLMEVYPYRESVFILDVEYIQEDKVNLYLNKVNNHDRKMKEVLINNNKDIKVSFVLQFSNVVGVFFKDDSLDHITDGLKGILTGRFSLSNEIAQKIIEYYRENDSVSSRTYADLTSREEEILKLLLLGSSNGQIAEKLFVSENTVKTHLHHVFKKIKVRNRLQALMWAKKYKFDGAL